MKSETAVAIIKIAIFGPADALIIYWLVRDIIHDRRYRQREAAREAARLARMPSDEAIALYLRRRKMAEQRLVVTADGRRCLRHKTEGEPKVRPQSLPAMTPAAIRKRRHRAIMLAKSLRPE